MIVERKINSTKSDLKLNPGDIVIVKKKNQSEIVYKLNNEAYMTIQEINNQENREESEENEENFEDMDVILVNLNSLLNNTNLNSIDELLEILFKRFNQDFRTS